MHDSANQSKHHPSCPARHDGLAPCVGCGIPRTTDLMAQAVVAAATAAVARRRFATVHTTPLGDRLRAVRAVLANG